MSAKAVENVRAVVAVSFTFLSATVATLLVTASDDGLFGPSTDIGIRVSHMQASLVYGAGDHQRDKTESSDTCTSSTYSSCGGGNCGSNKHYTHNMINNYEDKSASCSSKVCGGAGITCGSRTSSKCT
jgi:hypothetical protein